MALAAPIEKVAGGLAVVVSSDMRPDHHQLLGFGIRHGLEQSGVDDGVDGGGGSDAESQSENDGESEAAVLEDHAQAIADVSHQVVHLSPRLGTGSMDWT